MRHHPTNPWVVLVLICLAQFMVILDATIVNVALPSIQTDLDLSEANLQWIVNAYTLVFGGFLLLGGRAGDLLGRKRALPGRPRHLHRRLAARRARAARDADRRPRAAGPRRRADLAGGAVDHLDDVRGGAERAKALGVWAAIAIGGSAVGLILGGVLTEAFSWPWIFFVNVPVGIVGLRPLAAARARVEGRARAPAASTSPARSR